MRVLMWQEQHPTVHGGAESWVIDTSTALRRRGHEVSWLQTNQIVQPCGHSGLMWWSWGPSTASLAWRTRPT